MPAPPVEPYTTHRPRGLRRRLRRGAEAASPLAAHLSQRGERVAKGGAVQATRGRRGRQRQRRCCCCGGGRHGLGLPRRRHCPGGARTLLDSGTHLGLRATYCGYTYRAPYYSYSLLTAAALARLAAASCARRACSAGCVCASEVGSERIIAHLVVGGHHRAPGGFRLPCAAYRLDLGGLQLEDGRDRRPELLLHAVARRAQEAEQALAQEEELGGLRPEPPASPPPLAAAASSAAAGAAAGGSPSAARTAEAPPG
eukprot:scaffold119619_cov61-Phaeocystis_antarctica.AAC.6